MSMVKTVVNRPVMMMIVFIVVLVMGLFTAKDLAIDLYPDIEFPVIIVMTQNTGSGPSEIEQRVTRVLESSLVSVSGIKQVTSQSSKGYSLIQLEFKYGKDLDVATNDVRDKLSMVKRYLPDSADEPTIFKFDPSMMPIMNIVVQGNRTPEEVYKLADDIISPRLEQIDGVASVSIWGGRKRQIRIECSLNRLNALNLTLSEIIGKIAYQNIEVSAGTITKGNLDLLLQTSGEYKSIDDVKSTVISYKGGKPIRLDDVAHVYDGYEDKTTIVRYNGNETVRISVSKQSGSNSVQVADRVLAKLPQILRDLPNDMKMDIARNTTDQIRQSIGEVVSSALSGALLAVIVLFIFLRDIRSTLIMAVAIPVSIVITLFLMAMSGYSLNMLTLAGLTLGVGMLVDNSIVVLENIFKYREKGAKLTTAAEIGTTEMVMAITASTLTTICVFLPIVMFKSKLEIMGEMIGALAFTVVVALVASIAVAIFLVPVLASHYLPVQSKLEKNYPKFIAAADGFADKMFTGLDNAYSRAIRWCLRHRLIVILVVLALLVGSVMMIPKIGIEFAPQQEADSVTLAYELPLGTALDYTEAMGEQLLLIVQKEIKGYTSLMCSYGGSKNMLGNKNTYYGEIQIKLEKDKEKRIDHENDIKKKLRTHFDDFPNAKFSFKAGGGGGMGSSSPIDFAVKSNDMDKAISTAKKIRDIIKENVPEATEPMLDTDDGLPELTIKINREKAYSMGLTIAGIANEVKYNINGQTASQYREGGDEYDILVILQEEDRKNVLDLENVFVLSPTTGQKVPLSSVAQVIETTGPVTIKREDQMRTVHVQAGKVKEAKLNEVMAQIQSLINERVARDDSVFISQAGDMKDLKNIGGNLIMVLLMAIILVYAVMACQFESFLDPFIIMFTMPLMIIGVVGFYLILGEPFNMFNAIGLLVLLGVVVNNGIVLVDYTNLMVKRGHPIKEACAIAGGSRLRPILMSVLTTLLGLLPMALNTGEGSELMTPIARTLVGGLTTSTIFTLFLVPVLYSMFKDLQQRVGHKRAIKAEAKRQLRRKRLMERIKEREALEAKRAAEEHAGTVNNV